MLKVCAACKFTLRNNCELLRIFCLAFRFRTVSGMKLPRRQYFNQAVRDNSGTSSAQTLWTLRTVSSDLGQRRHGKNSLKQEAEL
jgi:hypothetical protein